jgi:simple sugar transport system permease protein
MKQVLGNFLRQPWAAAVLSLIGVTAFFVLVGGVNFGNFIKAASWVNFAANMGIIAIPVGLLMIAGEIDISVGAMVPAGSMTVAILSGYYELPIVVGVVGALAVGLLLGLINGLIAVRTKVPTLIITLGTLMGMQGVVLASANLLTGQASVILNAPDWAKQIFGQLIGNGHQIVIVWWVLIALVTWFFVHKGRIGNWIFALGGDKVSARNAGIPTDKVTIGLFMLSATSAAFVGVCQAIQFNSAQVSGGMGIIFNVIVAAVVGGTLLTGGYGSVLGMFIGTLTFAVVIQGIYFTSIDRNWSNLVVGVMLLAAVGLNNRFRKAAINYRPKKEA